jgi:acetyl-CoA carboxylase biotin carboxylase subunit
MKKGGVPVIPGSDGIVKDVKEGKKVSHLIGFPVIIKASAGGGGKGMRIVWEEKEFDKAFQMARSEADSAFANPDVYVEKFLEKPRHIEFQIMGDSFGRVYHYGERDCSIQRRHQKLIEESPSPAFDEEIRRKMGEAAIQGAKAINYEGAGTIEFLLDKNRKFYFMEMNTRIQVEHPVTELVYEVDLVRQQILVAAGEKIDTLPKKPTGHSMEFRINAEDPENGFRPSPGKIQSLHFPGGFGIRVDSHIYQSYSIPPYYDSLIAKLIIWGKNREHAVARARRALEEFIVEGISTTIPFHLKVLEDERFLTGSFDTAFLDHFKF